jgi:hypothetical protein
MFSDGMSEVLNNRPLRNFNHCNQNDATGLVNHVVKLRLELLPYDRRHPVEEYFAANPHSNQKQ